jgi:chromosome segregation ATPase
MTRHAVVLGRVLPALLFAAMLALSSAPSAFAQGKGSATPDAVTPVEEFSKQIEALKKTFTDLGKKIDESTKTIDGITDVDKARRELEELRAIVGNLLGAVSDNGAVAQLGAKATAHSRDKLKSLERETRFSKEELAFLVGEWRKLVEETERATDDLGAARKEFVQLLRTLQTREDFIDELMQIRRAAEALRVIRQLANEIRNASDSLKNLIRAIKPPGV